MYLFLNKLKSKKQLTTTDYFFCISKEHIFLLKLRLKKKKIFPNPGLSQRNASKNVELFHFKILDMVQTTK